MNWLAPILVPAVFAAFAGTAQVGAAPRVHLAGDSTMADKPTDPPNPEHGWGQLLPKFFRDPAMIVNHARNGRSTRSFITEGRWQQLVDALRPGDWVIIQFAHNDEMIFPDARGEFQVNLRKFVEDVRETSASLDTDRRLCTPARRIRGQYALFCLRSGTCGGSRRSGNAPSSTATGGLVALIEKSDLTWTRVIGRRRLGSPQEER